MYECYSYVLTGTWGKSQGPALMGLGIAAFFTLESHMRARVVASVVCDKCIVIKEL